jgi:hypothetical protein
MTVLYLEALAGIALPLSVLEAVARMVQQRAGNSGRVGLAGADSALWPQGGERYRDYQSRTSMSFPQPPQEGVVT